MIDPQIFESAYKKRWSCEEFLVIISAISSADDDGRGEISLLCRNISEMLSAKKIKSLLLGSISETIVCYGNDYYYLPKWNEYQTINRPKKSKLPDPKNYIFTDSSLTNHGQVTDECDAIEVKLSKDKLREEELKGKTSDSSARPNFKSKKDMTSVIEHWYTTYASRVQIIYDADIKPILNIISTVPEHMTEEINYNVVRDSFISLAQSNRKDTSYLLGIIKTKLIREKEKICKAIKAQEKSKPYQTAPGGAIIAEFTKAMEAKKV